MSSNLNKESFVGDKIVNISAEEEMDYFDILPPKLRAILANSKHKRSSKKLAIKFWDMVDKNPHLQISAIETYFADYLKGQFSKKDAQYLINTYGTDHPDCPPHVLTQTLKDAIVAQ